MWSITLSAQRVAALRKHDWSDIGSGDPFVKHRGPGDEYRIRMVNGHCFFLDENNRCHIHNKLGYHAKPVGCRAFPAHFTEVDSTAFARLSFYCPSVVQDDGQKLSEQMPWLRAVKRSTGDIARTAALTLTPEIEITIREIERIEAHIEHWIEMDTIAWNTRLAACGGLLARLVAETEKNGKRAIDDVLKESRQLDIEDFAKTALQQGRAKRAGPIISLFLGSDCKPRPLTRLGHFFNVRLSGFNLQRLSSYAVGGKASLRAIQSVSFQPNEKSQNLISRYWIHKLRGRRHLDGHLSLVAGFNLIAVAYAVAHLLARLRAASENRSAINDDDVVVALQSTDLLVLEHATITKKPAFAAILQRLLNDPTLCASLILSCS